MIAESARPAFASAALASARRWSNSARQPPQLAGITQRQCSAISTASFSARPSAPGWAV